MQNKNLAKHKLQLTDFNNLTKSLGFNIYDFFYTSSNSDRDFFLSYLDTHYSASALQTVLTKIARKIGAHVLSVSKQDYKPMGASVNLLIAEEENENTKETDSICMLHLDKSHVVAHTYPYIDKVTGIASVRVDIDLATCGQVVPLNAIDDVIDIFKSNIVILDYRVRGFTCDAFNKKHYLDHSINSIADFISPAIRKKYHIENTSYNKENIFYSKMIVNQNHFNHTYRFKQNKASTSTAALSLSTIKKKLYDEMLTIYHKK